MSSAAPSRIEKHGRVEKARLLTHPTGQFIWMKLAAKRSPEILKIKLLPKFKSHKLIGSLFFTYLFLQHNCVWES